MRSVGTATTTLLIHGGTGRMGRAIVSLLAGRDDVRLGGIIDLRGPASKETPHPVLTQLLERPRSATAAEVVVDFSHAEALPALLEALTGSSLPLVCGTTGLTDSQRNLLKEYSKKNAVFYDENMSYGVSVLKLILQTARPLLAGMDTEIVEYHHSGKKDAPSGTALALAKAISPDIPVVLNRSSSVSNTKGGLPIHSIRAGNIPGEHYVVFAADDEVITFSHRALSRDVFARGAIEAARFIATKPTGYFSMEDLLEGSNV